MRNKKHNRRTLNSADRLRSIKGASTLGFILLLYLTAFGFSSSAKSRGKALVILEQGSFAVGGTVITNPGTFNPYNQTPEGQTFHGDHAYVFYQIPDKARKYPWVI